jgi:hypothetical protein
MKLGVPPVRMASIAAAGTPASTASSARVPFVARAQVTHGQADRAAGLMVRIRFAPAASRQRPGHWGFERLLDGTLFALREARIYTRSPRASLRRRFGRSSRVRVAALSIVGFAARWFGRTVMPGPIDAMGRAARMATSSLNLTMECRDAPAERLEQVPRCSGPK